LAARWSRGPVNAAQLRVTHSRLSLRSSSAGQELLHFFFSEGAMELVIDPKQTTLADAQSILRSHVRTGAVCPCCKQFAKVYRRKITSTMALGLVQVHKYFENYPDGWLHVRSFLSDRRSTASLIALGGGEFGKLVHWSLVEAMPGDRSDGAKHNGFYRITEKGHLFVQGEITVPRYVYIYDSRRLGFSEELISIHEALGDRFNYEELMGRL
jgi:hypothetical protein